MLFIKSIILTFFMLSTLSYLSASDIPSVYSLIKKDKNGKYYIQKGSERFYANEKKSSYTLEKMQGSVTGTATGLQFSFGDSIFTGTLYYGFIHYNDSRFPLPVYTMFSSKVKKGMASISFIDKLDGIFDMIGWEKNKYGTLGYRVLDSQGRILYDGRIQFFYDSQNGFSTANTIVEGPFVNKLLPNKVTVSFNTSENKSCVVEINGDRITSSPKNGFHILDISGLTAGKEYTYSVTCGRQKEIYSFATPPLPGNRKPFTFAYASDSRSAKGGGERDLWGVNGYVLKKIMALTAQKNAKFIQFSGDLINGYLIDRGELELQYANWKRVVEPWWHYMPIYTTMGNHESYMKVFKDQNKRFYRGFANFPFATESSEAVYAQEFVNFENGPESEDGSQYDPNPETIDFPSYKESVYYYTYDNIAVILLNSDYFYSPSLAYNEENIEGNLHGYIMDNQLAWFEKTVLSLESNDAIDHVFVTLHTPFFPNGGHMRDDMWYNGNNEKRPIINGRKVDKGIIERRDELLDIMANKSKKIIGILTGDEHNYCKLTISPGMKMYPEIWEKPKLKLSRTLYQINNGAAGAPYYAQEIGPWSDNLQGFTTQYAVVLIHIDGTKVAIEVLNPDTLEKIDYFILRE